MKTLTGKPPFVAQNGRSAGRMHRDMYALPPASSNPAITPGA